MKNTILDVSRKWILSNMIRAVSTLITFGGIHFLLTSENEFFMKYNATELQVYMEFMCSFSLQSLIRSTSGVAYGDGVGGGGMISIRIE